MATTQILPDRYPDIEPLAQGAMGNVYRATDTTLDRVVAVKLLAEPYVADDSARRRFAREARAAARVSSDPNIVTIFDVGDAGARPYIVMEYIAGSSLEERLRSGRQKAADAMRWLEQAGRALDYAHSRGVVHRDVKPGNLLLDRQRNVHVADFGIASAAGMDSLTMTGTVLGTAGYLSPEQAQGDRATPASDRYGLGIVAFELLTGTRPFEADSPTAEAAAHVNAPVPSISARADLPREIDRCFARALAKDPAERFESCADFVAALRAAFADAAGQTRQFAAVAPTVATRPLPARRSSGAWPLLGALLLAGAVAGALLAYFLTRGDSSPTTAPTTVVTHVQTVTTQGQVRTVDRRVTVTTSQVTTAAAPTPTPAPT